MRRHPPRSCPAPSAAPLSAASAARPSARPRASRWPGGLGTSRIEPHRSPPPAAATTPSTSAARATPATLASSGAPTACVPAAPSDSAARADTVATCSLGRASRRGGPNVIAATDDRPPTANRSWLGISLIDSLKESDTPHVVQLDLVPQLQELEEHRQCGRPPGPGRGLGVAQDLAEVDIGIGRLHLPQRTSEPVPDQLQMVGVVADGAVGQP